MLHLFLLASADPNANEPWYVTAMSCVRAGDARSVSLLLRYPDNDANSVSLLLRYWADPVQCELGHPDPIFIAIRGDFPQGVRLLLNHRANTEAQQNYATLADSSGHGNDIEK